MPVAIQLESVAGTTRRHPGKYAVPILLAAVIVVGLLWFDGVLDVLRALLG
jgi:hypothetical protein